MKKLILAAVFAATAFTMQASQRVPFVDSGFTVQNNTFKKLKIQFYNLAQPTKALAGDPAYEQDRPYVPKNQSIKIPAAAKILNVIHSDKGEKAVVIDHLSINPTKNYVITYNKASDTFFIN